MAKKVTIATFCVALFVLLLAGVLVKSTSSNGRELRELSEVTLEASQLLEKIRFTTMQASAQGQGQVLLALAVRADRGSAYAGPGGAQAAQEAADAAIRRDLTALAAGLASYDQLVQTRLPADAAHARALGQHGERLTVQLKALQRAVDAAEPAARLLDLSQALALTEQVLLKNLDTALALQRGALEQKMQGLRSATTYVSVGIWAGLTVCAALIMLMGALLSRHIARPIATLTQALLDFAAGRHGTRVESKRRDELGELTEAFNLMADELEKDIARRDWARSQLAELNTTLDSRIDETATELVAAKDAAEAANRAKSDFLANMGGEIRKPMSALIGLAHLALQRASDPQQRDQLLRIELASRALLTIVNDILDLSKIEAGTLALERHRFDLYSLLNDVATQAGVRAQEKQIEFQLEADPELPSSLVGDPARITQVLSNLCGNAIRLTEQGHVTLKVRLEQVQDDQVTLEFSVQTDGAGAAMADRVKLFEPFTGNQGARGDGGLGLWIARRLVQLMGGRLSVDSLSGQSSAFNFTLVCGQAERLPRLPDARTQQLQDLRALLIDDDENFLTVARARLEGWRMRVTTARNVRQGLDALVMAAGAGQPCELVLLDWKMPDLDGLTACALIRSDTRITPQPKILIVTASRDGGLEDRAIAAMADGILVKPMTPMALSDALIRLAQTVTPGHGGLVCPDLRGVRILLVEDDLMNREIALAMLVATGAELNVAGNGREALEMVTPGRFDLVLMDVQMPEMDGIEATRNLRLRFERSELPIIALTASALAGDRERLIQAGMNDYVAKPISVRVLYAVLTRWVKSRVTADMPS